MMCGGFFCKKNDFEWLPLRSSHVYRKNYFKFRDIGTPAGVPISHFHRGGRGGKQHLQRRFLRKCGATGKVSASLQQADPSCDHFPFTTLCVKMRLERSAERDKRKNKNNPSSDYAQSTAEGILNRFVCLKRLSAEKQQTAFSAPSPCNLCNCDNFS